MTSARGDDGGVNAVETIFIVFFSDGGVDTE